MDQSLSQLLTSFTAFSRALLDGFRMLAFLSREGSDSGSLEEGSILESALSALYHSEPRLLLEVILSLRLLTLATTAGFFPALVLNKPWGLKVNCIAT